MKALYIAIEQRIKDFLPDVKHIDLWNNQTGNLDKEHPMPFPAIFIEFTAITWQKLNYKCKRGTVALRIHLVQENYADSFEGSPNQADALIFLDLVKTADNVFENFAPQGCTPFDGVLLETDVNHDNLIDHILEYQFDYTVAITAPGKTYVETSPDLKVEGEIN